MLIKADLVDKITKIFGTRNQLFYRYLWIADCSLGAFKRGAIVSIVRKRSGEYRGLLLVPVMSQPWDREFGGPDPLRYVEFTDWEDKVHNLLKFGIVLSEEGGNFMDGRPYFLDFYISSQNMDTNFGYNSDFFHDEERMNDKFKLGLAVIETIHFLAKAYNHPEINKCLEPPTYQEPEE